VARRIRVNGDADAPIPINQGVEFIICGTCLNYFGLTDKVQVGTIGGMPAIIEALSRAEKVISV
jgi:sulfur relay (sulfurtransferase) complex TusBCD TusD component (DsrE family)